MINYLDNLLRHLFIKQVMGITDDTQVRFQPPDNEWRTYVANLQRLALNVYLVELRENRRLRTNERTRAIQNGYVMETPAPQRTDCHYLISAWSPATDTQAVEPTLDEHALLYNVTAVLMDHLSLVPRQVYAPDPLPPGFPALIADAELPNTVLPVEGFPKYAEFWGTMGTAGSEHPWNPAVYLIVTLPVALQQEIAGPMVTTRITEYRQTDLPATAEVWIQIGGSVLDPSGAPVPAAWVQLETTTNNPLQTMETDDLGHFTFGGLRAGIYRLRTSAVGLGERTRDVAVPSPTGEYDLRFP
jgi:hypothetical protein